MTPFRISDFGFRIANPRSALLFVALSLAPGCSASFRAGRLERGGAWPPGPPADAAKLRSVAISFDGVWLDDGREFPMSPRKRFLYRNATHWAYYLSGRFTHVRPAPALADLRIEARLVERHACSPAALRVAHALTLGLLPAWERHEWTLATTVSDQDGKELGHFEKSEAVHTWHQFLLLLAFPFAPPPGVAADCIFDLNRATILEAFTRGVY